MNGAVALFPLVWMISVTAMISVFIFFSSDKLSTPLQMHSSSTDLAAVARPLYVRKEIRSLTTDELERYFAAIWEYKLHGRRDNRPYMKTYDDMVSQHAVAVANITVKPTGDVVTVSSSSQAFHFNCRGTKPIIMLRS
jgi:hypothetical protein